MRRVVSGYRRQRCQRRWQSRSTARRPRGGVGGSKIRWCRRRSTEIDRGLNIPGWTKICLLKLGWWFKCFDVA